MYASARSRVNKGQILYRAGAFFFAATGLFLGALLAALG